MQNMPIGGFNRFKLDALVLGGSVSQCDHVQFMSHLKHAKSAINVPRSARWRVFVRDRDY